MLKYFSVLFCLICFGSHLAAQADESKSPIVFIYDASGSMWGQLDGKTKMTIATDVLSESVGKLPAEQQVGFVAYGHRQKGDCNDVEFMVPMTNKDKSKVVNSLKGIKPLGKTPLAYSATQVINELRTSKSKATIILITDGIESCGGDLCAVIKAAKEEGIAFRLHIVGFGLKADETEALKCAAKEGEGQYYDAADAGGLSDVLNEATNTTVDDPVHNFSVYAVKNGKPVDAYVKAYKAGTKTDVNSVRTYQDTGFFYLPPGKYDLVANPLENSDVKAVTISNVESVEGKIGHQSISFDGGQINVLATNNGEGWDAIFKFFNKEDGKPAATQRTYGVAKPVELNPGQYEVLVQALVIEGPGNTYRYENVEVKGNAITDFKHEFKSGIVMVGSKSGGTLVDATVNFYDKETNKNVAAARTYTSASSNPKKFILSPGTYKVVIKPLAKYAGNNSTIEITVKENKTVEHIHSF